MKDKFTSFDNIFNPKKEKEVDRLDRMLSIFYNMRPSDGFDFMYSEFRHLGFSTDAAALETFGKEIKEKIHSGAPYQIGHGEEKVIPEGSRGRVEKYLEEFIEKVRSLNNHENKNVDFRERLGKSSNKLSMKELAALDPESSNENGDIASVIFILTKVNNPAGFYTRESLIDELMASEEGNPEIRPRVEKTVSNFIEKGYLKDDGAGKLVADFDVAN